MLHWRIYYDDGTTFDNLQGLWEKAPDHGVICVVVRDPSGAWGRFVNSGWAPKAPVCDECKRQHFNEYYVKTPESNEPQATPNILPFDKRMRALGHNNMTIAASIKYGRNADQQIWNDIMLAAANDPDFPKGTPRRRRSDFEA